MRFNLISSLYIRGAKRVPLIRFPDRHGLGSSHSTNSSHTVNNTFKTSSPSSSTSSNKNYIDISQVPQRLKMRKDEIDLISVSIKIQHVFTI
eukprot:gene5367-6697_t